MLDRLLSGAENPAGSLKSMEVLTSLSNPETLVPMQDLIGLIGGGLLGWWIVRKNPGMGKYVGVLIGAELGIMITRKFFKSSTVSQSNKLKDIPFDSFGGR